MFDFELLSTSLKLVRKLSNKFISDSLSSPRRPDRRDVCHGSEMQSGLRYKIPELEAQIMDLRQIGFRTKSRDIEAASEAVTAELSEEQLSSVSGGKGKASPVL